MQRYYELRTTGVAGYSPKNNLGINENYIGEKLGETLRGIYEGYDFIK